MNYVEQSKTLKRANMLYNLFKTIRDQIPDEKVDSKKTYTVKVEGWQIGALKNISCALYNKSRGWQSARKSFFR
jgi:hypothetical protein